MQVQINLQLLPTLMFVCKTWVIVSVGFTIHDERKYKKKKKNIFERTKDSDNWIISNSSYEELRSLDEIRAKVNYERVQDVLYCLDVLKRHVSPSNLKTIYKNLSNLSVERNPSILKLGYDGQYFTFFNKIVLGAENALPHEFIHASSSAYNHQKGIGYSGFVQYDSNKDIKICEGLNEGYTELLTARWFFNGVVKSNHNLVRIVELFEFFFDNPKDMETYYFNHNLPGFIKYMEQFSSKKEIIEILSLIDAIRKGEKIPSLIKFFDEAKILLKLYRMYQLHCQDPFKLKLFEEKIKQFPLARLALAGQKLKLFRDYSYGKMHNEEQKRR